MSTMKRFRPSIESVCSFAHCVESPSSIPCAHCPLTFCLRHLVEHQTAIDNEHKHLISSIETCRTRLNTIQSIDNRYELCEQLDEWQMNMIDHVNRMKNEINLVYEQYDQEFTKIKDVVLNKFDEDERSLKEISLQLEQSLHILESSRLNLIISKINPIIHLVKPNLNISISADFDDTSKLDLNRFLTLSTINFSLDYDPTDSTIIATSSEHLLIYKSSRSIFQLFNDHGEHLYDINYDHMTYGDVNQIIWSSFVNGFLLTTTKQVLKLNYITKRIGRYVDIGFGYFKDICAHRESIVLVHNLGTSLGDVLEHYSNNQMIQRCWKADLYPDRTHMKDTMEIFRIRMSDYLIAIDTLFTEKILICDVRHAMKCLFRIDTHNCNILSMSSVYDTQQWLLFVTDEHDESLQRRMLLINTQENDPQRRMHELQCDQHLLPTNLYFFGPNHFILVRTENKDDDTMILECRNMHHIMRM
ncbi:hypothetical protein I4U23_000954 [Adineta vaga]|nr:hypothetical protein I4U23_000954 [Adineta vaga]